MNKSPSTLKEKRSTIKMNKHNKRDNNCLSNNNPDNKNISNTWISIKMRRKKKKDQVELATSINSWLC